MSAALTTLLIVAVTITLIPTAWRILLAFSDLLESLTDTRNGKDDG